MLDPARADGRLISDVAAEWGRNHGQAVTLHLEGAAGGTYAFGAGAQEIRIDAVDFCRILAGRAPGTGLLATAVNF